MGDLDKLIAKSRADWAKMSPDERRQMIDDQRRSWGRAEAAFGSDTDEADYRAAIESGDPDRIAEAKLLEALRVAAFDEGK